MIKQGFKLMNNKTAIKIIKKTITYNSIWLFLSLGKANKDK